MIVYTDINDKAAAGTIDELCRCGGICACRTLCLWESYAQYPGLAELWIQYDENSHASSSVIKYGGDMTVVLSDRSDISELRDFITAVGTHSVISEGDIFRKSSHAIIMKREIFSGITDSSAKYDLSVSLDDAYGVMKSCRSESFAVPQYEDFILDTSHRLRHGNAHCCTLYENNIPAAFAMTAALSRTQAVIGSVCTAPEYRRKGFGSRCINGLCSKLGNREIFIVRAEGENEQFYLSFGFAPCNKKLSIYIN